MWKRQSIAAKREQLLGAGVEMLDPYELQGVSMAEGWIYFAVPRDAGECVLWLQSQTLDRNYDLASVEMTGVPLTVQEGSVSDQ